jgi:hypothetical protein
LPGTGKLDVSSLQPTSTASDTARASFNPMGTRRCYV